MRCPFCDKIFMMTDLRDNLSMREAEISEICQECQDKTFKEDKI